MRATAGSMPSDRAPASGATAPIFPGGVAVLISQSATTRLSNLQLRHSCPEGRSLGVDLAFAGTAFTFIALYAPSTAASHPQFSRHSLLPRLPSDRSLILGGGWNCISSEVDLLDPAGNAASRLPGYWEGLRQIQAAQQALRRLEGAQPEEADLQTRLALQQYSGLLGSLACLRGRAQMGPQGKQWGTRATIWASPSASPAPGGPT